jgi:hypothetical protein
VIVIHHEYDPGLTLDGSGDSYHGGCIGPWMEGSKEPSRPIGFRMPEPEPVVDDPSWMLL